MGTTEVVSLPSLYDFPTGIDNSLTMMSRYGIEANE